MDVNNALNKEVIVVYLFEEIGHFFQARSQQIVCKHRIR